MFGSHMPLLARCIGLLLVFFSEMGSCLSWSKNFLVFFSKTFPCCSDPGIDFFFCSVFEVCGLYFDDWGNIYSITMNI